MRFYRDVWFFLLSVTVPFSCQTTTGNEIAGTRENCGSNNTPTDTRVNTKGRLQQLRQRMRASSYDAYIVPTDDEHQSEYVSDHDKRREYISGFTGSAGTAVVLQNESALWTDGRYFLQAEQELDCNWLLMKRNLDNVPPISEWLGKLPNGSNVGADPKLLSYSQWTDLKEELQEFEIHLVGDNNNLIDDIWSLSNGRAPESVSQIFVHDIRYAGKSWQEKVKDLRQSLAINNAEGIVITALDEISWLFNLRGSDIQNLPVFKAYAFISKSHIRLYIKSLKLTDVVRRHLHSMNCSSFDCVHIMEYLEVFEDIPKLVKPSGKILLSSLSSYFIVNLVPEDSREIEFHGPSLVSSLRAVKNPVETQGMKAANVREAVAIVDFISRLDKEISEGHSWDELKASSVLSRIRLKQDLSQGDSFTTISASGSNAAIVHYSPSLSTNKSIDAEHIYLLDTGGQYLDGTTDTTRTLHFGQPTNFQKEAYTRVLMGAINLMMTVFPLGVRDMDLDIMAREQLYKVGLDYFHGTGHGIGSYLSVHEAPILIGKPSQRKGHVLKPGMFMSDEPGYYQDGEFGIRLETVMMVVKAKTPHNFNDFEYYTFESVSFVPFEPKLIDLHLLSKEQKEWLNCYNAKARDTVGVELRRQKRERGYQYLLAKTEFLPVDDCLNHATKCHVNFTLYLLLFILYCNL